MRVVLADHRDKVRSALRLLIEQEAGLAVCGEVEDAATLMKLAEARHADLVLLDDDLPGNGLRETIAALRRAVPRTIVIVLSSRPEVCQAVLEAGADAFVSKGDPPETLLEAIRRARFTGIR